MEQGNEITIKKQVNNRQTVFRHFRVMGVLVSAHFGSIQITHLKKRRTTLLLTGGLVN